MNTATIREEARQAAEQADWQRAADLYKQAIALYPNPVGRLAKKDLAHLETMARSCQDSADFVKYVR